MTVVDLFADRPAPTIVGTRRSDEGIVVGRQLPPGEGRNVGGHGWVPPSTAALQADDWPENRPATTIAGDTRVFQPGVHHIDGQQSQNAVRVSLQEALVLQDFDPATPVQGSKSKAFEQVGNAVPVGLALAALSVVVPIRLREAA